MLDQPIEYARSAGGVVLNSVGQILVVKQSSGTWSLPKGHIEEGESELETAKREIYEESGVKDLELIKKLGEYSRSPFSDDKGYDTSRVKTLYFFLFKTKDILLKPIDPHNPEARWVDKDKVAEMLSNPKDKEFFENILGEI